MLFTQKLWKITVFVYCMHSVALSVKKGLCAGHVWRTEDLDSIVSIVLLVLCLVHKNLTYHSSV